jgi:hypothetical protein
MHLTEQRKRHYKALWLNYMLLKQTINKVYSTFSEQRALVIQ